MSLIRSTSPLPAASQLAILVLAAVAFVPRAATADPRVARPLHGHSRAAFGHFVQDALPPLVKGRTWESKGHSYEVVRLHSIVRTATTRWEPAHHAADDVHRGWTVATIHVRVDGRLMKGRIEGTARYMTMPGGWEWERVLLYLGANESFDFVRGTTD